jgi:hypothetical protein
MHVFELHSEMVELMLQTKRQAMKAAVEDGTTGCSEGLREVDAVSAKLPCTDVDYLPRI